MDMGCRPIQIVSSTQEKHLTGKESRMSGRETTNAVNANRMASRLIRWDGERRASRTLAGNADLYFSL